MLRYLLPAVLTVVLLAPPANAQGLPKGPYLPVEPIALPLDRDGVWTLNFAYIPPRIITVDTPDRGRRTVWYMVYQLWNKTDTPIGFVPEFELVTKDGRLINSLDEPQPSVVKKIREIERTGEIELLTSVSISKNKIPVTKADSVPRAVHGVAVWLDLPEQAARVNNFSVYVIGLSNGLAVSENDSGVETISRKTLQLDFLKPTDDLRPQQNDIRPNENAGLGASKWIYRVIPLKKPAAPIAEDKK